MSRPSRYYDAEDGQRPLPTDVDAIAALVPEPQIIQAADGRFGYLVTPKDVTITEVDLEQFQDRPAAARNTVLAHTVDALIDYVGRHYLAERTSLWVDADALKVTAILDDHEGPASEDMRFSEPDWRRHRAVLQLKTTPQWRHWTEKDEKPFDQVAFAEHIEDAYNDLTTPDPAAMLEMAQHLEGTAGGAFKSRQRLADGSVSVRFEHEVTITGGGAGEIAFPDKLELLLPPLVGEDAVKLTARLRVRVGGGDLKLQYKLDRPDEVLRDACDLIVERLRSKFEHVYLGRPE